MRTFTDGNGNDSTSAVLAHLAAHRALFLSDLYVINTAPTYAGNYLGKQFLLTKYDRPLNWNFRGTFLPAQISRDGVTSKIGLEADTVNVTWSPKDSDILAKDGSGNAILTALQGFGSGVFDNGVLEVWRCVMPTEGDCNTLGACLLFSGRIGDLEPDRLSVRISVISRLEVLNIQVPTNVIEPTNIMAQYSIGVTPSGGPSPNSFSIVSGSTTQKIFADATPTMPADTYDNGYVVFTSGKLAGTYRGIRTQDVESGHHAFYLIDRLPFAPATGDTLAAYIPVPIDYAGATLAGLQVAAFPFVPSLTNSPVVIA